MDLAQSFLGIFLDEVEDTLQHWESDCLKLNKGESKAAALQSVFRHAHNLKGTAKSVGQVAFAEFVHSAEDLITLLMNDKIACTPDTVALLLECQAVLASWGAGLRADPQHVEQTQALAARLKLAASAGGLQPLQKLSSVTKAVAGDIFWADEVNTQSKAEPGSAAPATGEQVHLAEVNVAPGAVPVAEDTLRVPVARIDALIRLAGELAIQSAILTNATRNEAPMERQTQQAAALIAKAVSDLQTEALNLRMQSVGGLLQRMERVLRDVSRQLGKEIAIQVSGSEVELDKSVLERMKDPLVHILRNAVDHGVEDKETRVAAGKAAVANISVSAEQTSGSVTLTIRDDGKGLDKEKIFSKAVEKGLIDPSSKLFDADVFSLIFLPGFSTADRVTDVSGRGVGMDVVKRAVDEIGGKISIESSRGKGTTFQINIPSSLSITDVIIVDVESNLYAVPIQDIEEVVHINSLRAETVSGSSMMINLRGKVIPLKKLSMFLSNTESRESVESDRVAIVARSGRDSVALEVDRIFGQQSVVVRKLDGKLQKVPGFSGGTILQNGEPGMIVHLPTILNHFAQERAGS